MTEQRTRKHTLAVIEAIIRLNAALIDEEPELVVRSMPKGWVRVWYTAEAKVRYGPNRQGPREYPTADRALDAALISLARALRIAGMELPVDDSRVTSWDQIR